MKATVKPEFVGQTHPRHGLLVGEVVYEIDEPNEIFEVKELATPKAKSAPVIANDPNNGGN